MAESQAITSPIDGQTVIPAGCWTRVPELPKCDLCGERARFDCRTDPSSPLEGAWANLCPTHFGEFRLFPGPGPERLLRSIGVGFGQMLIPPEEVETVLIIETTAVEEPAEIEVGGEDDPNALH